MSFAFIQENKILDNVGKFNTESNGSKDENVDGQANSLQIVSSDETTRKKIILKKASMKEFTCRDVNRFYFLRPVRFTVLNNFQKFIFLIFF